jgi:hypothetical protein
MGTRAIGIKTNASAGLIMGRKSASSFKKCRLQSEAADSLRSPTGRARANGRIVYKPAEHGEEPTHEVTDNLPDIVPVTQKEMEVIETYLAALVAEGLDIKEKNQRVKA